MLFLVHYCRNFTTHYHLSLIITLSQSASNRMQWRHNQGELTPVVAPYSNQFSVQVHKVRTQRIGTVIKHRLSVSTKYEQPHSQRRPISKTGSSSSSSSCGNKSRNGRLSSSSIQEPNYDDNDDHLQCCDLVWLNRKPFSRSTTIEVHWGKNNTGVQCGDYQALDLQLRGNALHWSGSSLR